jgi:hypothetical protein
MNGNHVGRNRSDSQRPPQDECEVLRSLLPAYSIGATDPEESRLVEELLPRCPEVATELETYGQIADSLLYAVPALEPPAHLRRVLLDAARADLPASRVPAQPRESTWEALRWALFGRSARLAVAVAGLLLVLLVGSNLYWISQVNTLQQRERDIQTLLAQRDQQLAAFGQPDTQRVELATTEQVEFAAQAVVYWHEESEVSLFATQGLPALEQGRTYELWLIRGDQADGVGLFKVGEDGSGALIFDSDEPISAYEAVGVTEEPEGGSVAPTSPPILLGTV